MKKKNIEKLLKMVRMFKGYSLKEVADVIDSNPTYLVLYESGKRIPKDNRILEMAKFLSIDPDILFYSFGLFTPQQRQLVEAYPFYYLEKIKKIFQSGPTLEDKTEQEINHQNKTDVGNYIISLTQEEKSDIKSTQKDGHNDT